MIKPLISRRAGKLSGEITVPGDKSISHRALILASQAVGQSEITGLLESEDVIHTAKALELMGVEIHKTKDAWRIDGVGTGGLSEPDDILYMGNSGTGTRLMMGLCATHGFTSFFSGDKSLIKRPMLRAITPLKKFGAEFITREKGLLPLAVIGAKNPMPISYELPVASAQVKSAILLAALNTPGKTTVIEKTPTRDHSELMMKYFGFDIEVKKNGGAREITLTGQAEIGPKKVVVPGDPSSAAFLVVAALIVPGSEIIIKNVCINPERIGLYTSLQEMGAKLEFLNTRENAGEKIADIAARYSELTGTEIPAARAPSMIDEYPILSIAAARANGKTIMLGLEELRVKESDRLTAIAEGLKVSGMEVMASENSLTVTGAKNIPGGKTIETHMDHRIAMSFAVLGMVSEKPVTINDGAMIDTSFPGFVELVNGVGGNIE